MRQFAFSNAGTVTVGTVDVTKHPQIGGELGIRSLPSYILYKNGQPQVVQTGYANGVLEAMVAKYD